MINVECIKCLQGACQWIISIMFYLFLWSIVSRMVGRVQQSMNKCICTIFGIEIESLTFVAHAHAHYITRSSCISTTCNHNIAAVQVYHYIGQQLLQKLFQNIRHEASYAHQTLCVPRGGTRLWEQGGGGWQNLLHLPLPSFAHHYFIHAPDP